MRIIKTFACILLGLAFLVFSCKKDTPAKPSCFQPDYSDSVQYNLYREWDFLGFLNLDQTENCAGEENDYFGLSLEPDRGDFRCYCNYGFIQTVHVNRDSLLLDEMFSTLVACDKYMDVERWFYQGLKTTRTFSIDQDILSLKTAEGTVLKFRAAK